MQKSDSKRFDTLYIATIALLVALQVVLSRFLSVPTPITKIGFSFVPLVIAARKYGVIDNQGKAILPMEYDAISISNERGLAEIAVSKDGEAYFINEQGERVSNI